MKLLLLISTIAVVFAAPRSGIKCGTDKYGTSLFQFSFDSERVRMPCKYNALRETQCGNYRIRLSPGNVYVKPEYNLDTIWLSVLDTSAGKKWEGRTTNLQAVKFFNGQGKKLFEQKQDDEPNPPDASELGLVAAKEDKRVSFGNNDFKVTIGPYDPQHPQFQDGMSWEFECNAAFTPSNFSVQVCGSGDLAEDQALSAGMEDYSKNMYYEVFTSNNLQLQQTDAQCREASSIMLDQCETKEQRVEAINTCYEILYDLQIAECVNQYACNPIEVFNLCIEWGCNDFNYDFKEATTMAERRADPNWKLCRDLSEATDQCSEQGIQITAGSNLEDIMQKANCYTRYRSIIYPSEA